MTRGSTNGESPAAPRPRGTARARRHARGAAARCPPTEVSGGGGTASWFRRGASLRRLQGATVGRALAGSVAPVELGVGGVEGVGVERDQRHTVVATLVTLDHQQRLRLARPDVAVGELEALAYQSEAMPPRREHLRGGAG